MPASGGVDMLCKVEELEADNLAEKEREANEQGDAHNNLWVRQEAPDGRIYFFNRSTGVSQWHVPNDLYLSRVWKDRSKLKQSLREDYCVKMPGSARAMLNVDCMTQIPGQGVPEHVRRTRTAMMDLLSGPSREFKQKERQPVLPGPILRLSVVRAEGLRDADFMPGRDKSDPYAMVEVVGKEEATRFKTTVIMDDLDPVWNHDAMIPEYESGDILSVSVWDEDDTTTTVKNAASLVDPELVEETLYAEVNTDECLGKTYITDDELAKAFVSETSYRLEETGPDIQSDIFLRATTLTGWPKFKGMKAPAVQDEIEFATPELRLVLIEQPDTGNEVVAWDMAHQKGGYMGMFIGVFAKDSAKLRRGDQIVCGRHRHTVKKVDRKGGTNKLHPLKPMVYVHLEEDIDGTIKVGDTWTKVTKTAEPGYQEDRVIVYFDSLSTDVVAIPVIG